MLAMTSSAMFDSRHVSSRSRSIPAARRPTTCTSASACTGASGAMIARAQITQTFKALLARASVERASGRRGSLALWGLFPDHLYVELRSLSAMAHAFITIVIPFAAAPRSRTSMSCLGTLSAIRRKATGPTEP